MSGADGQTFGGLLMDAEEPDVTRLIRFPNMPPTPFESESPL